MTPDVTLFGEARCPKTRFYQSVLDDSHLTCPFLRRVRQTRPEWRDRFNLKGPTNG